VLLANPGMLAQACSDAVRRPDAVRLREELLALHPARSGPHAPETLLAMDHLAAAYRSAGQHAEAVKTLEDELAVQVARLGPNNPDTFASRDKAYSAGRRFADAFKLSEETLARRPTVLGPDHPDTLGNISFVVVCLFNLGRGAGAVPLVDECVSHAGREDIDPGIVPGLMRLRLEHFEGAKDTDGCRATAEMWEKLRRTDAESLYTAARMRAVVAAVVRRAGAGAGLREEESVAEADRAMSWLRQAVAAGFHAAARLKSDRGLAALRDRDDFRTLVADLENKARPSEPARPAAPAK
jgi:Tetratricopeptide repeat